MGDNKTLGRTETDLSHELVHFFRFMSNFFFVLSSAVWFVLCWIVAVRVYLCG